MSNETENKIDLRSKDGLREKIAELEAKVKEAEKKAEEYKTKAAEGEEAALKRVCKALNVSPDDVVDTNKQVKEEPIIRCHVPSEVNINGKKYLGMVNVPLSTFHVLQQAIGDRINRRLREITGNDYILKEISGGMVAPQVVGKVDLSGERIS